MSTTRVQNTLVWKFVLHPGEQPYIPVGAKVLTVANQRNEVCLWALCDLAAEREHRDIVIVGTGHALPLQWPETGWRPYLGTAHGIEGDLVFHVFDEEIPF